MKEEDYQNSRRTFVKNTAYACTGFPFLMRMKASEVPFFDAKAILNMKNDENGSVIGAYGPWAANLLQEPARLSFRNAAWLSVDEWRPKAMEKTLELLAVPKTGKVQVKVLGKYVYDGLEVERISWQLPYGYPTEAVVLKPEGAKGPLPGVLGLHDHGGVKFFGWEKICQVSPDTRTLLKEHQTQYYEGRAWANELAKLGYVVMVHDAFAFGSRRVRLENVQGILWGHCHREEWKDNDPEKEEVVMDYNRWAGDHEAIMAKSLFSAGTTWPGVVLAEDQVALDVLAARDDVDDSNLGCCGLSGGGLRTVYLGGLDKRIKCAVCVGFMTTWKDFVLNKSFGHTSMTYAPLLPQYLDFPEIMGLRTPLPTLVQSCKEDDLFSWPEMQRSDRILSEMYTKARSTDRYKTIFYEGGHKFDIKMQTDAFDWFTTWLK